jgi:hypothetical protein
MIIKTKDDEFTVTTTNLSYMYTMNFDDLLFLKSEVDKLVSDEQSRLLQESLSGGFDDCDGCKI